MFSNTFSLLRYYRFFKNSPGLPVRCWQRKASISTLIDLLNELNSFENMFKCKPCQSYKHFW